MDTRVKKAVEKAQELGVELQPYAYEDHECSCCYGPHFWTDLPHAVLPLNVAQNQGGYVEPEIENYEYDPDDEDWGEEFIENPAWTPDANDNIVGGAVVKPIYIDFDMHKDVGPRLVEALTFAGFATVEWDGSETRCVIINPE